MACLFLISFCELDYTLSSSPSRTEKVQAIFYLPYGRGQGVGT